MVQFICITFSSSDLKTVMPVTKAVRIWNGDAVQDSRTVFTTQNGAYWMSREH